MTTAALAGRLLSSAGLGLPAGQRPTLAQRAGAVRETDMAVINFPEGGGAGRRGLERYWMTRLSLPLAPHLHPVLGRPSTPVECYLRLMFLKFRHARVPHPTR